MAMYRTGTVAAPLTIIGKDLSAYATFNGDTTPAVGVLRAGTLMKYTAATKTLDKAVVGTDTIYGVLADDIDTGAAGVTEIQPVMVYRSGTFLRQEIESANNVAITPGSAVDTALNGLGIHLELSYEGYLGLNPVPAGVQPMFARAEDEEEGEEEGLSKEEHESRRERKQREKEESKGK